MMHELLSTKLAKVPKNKLVETIKKIKQQNKLMKEQKDQSFIDDQSKDEEKLKSSPNIENHAKFVNTDLHINRAFHTFV